MRRAILPAVVVTLGWHVALFAADDGLPPMAPEALPDLGAIVVNLVAVLVPLGVLVRLGRSRTTWLRRLRPHEPYLLVPALLVALLPLTQGLQGSATALLSTALLFACVGLSEELLSRGAVQELLALVPPVPRVLWVGALFGLGHVLSAIWFERPVDDTVMQVVSAATFGVGYAALRLRTVVLWPLVALHGLDDWCQVNSPGALPFVVQVLVAAGWLGYGFWLARRAASELPTSSRTG